jgi:hypothetical protein
MEVADKAAFRMYMLDSACHVLDLTMEPSLLVGGKETDEQTTPG